MVKPRFQRNLLRAPAAVPLTILLLLGALGTSNPGGGAPPAGPGAPSPSPAPLAGKVIVLDPGHGGPNPGSIGVGPTPEKDNVLAIGLYAKELLEAAGAKVVMTRSADVDPSVGTPWEGQPTGQLDARVATANNSGADVFVSIHNNYNNDPSYTGIQVYYDVNRPESAPLAQALHQALLTTLGAADRGLMDGSWLKVLRETRMPAVLLEIGFLSNPDEAYRLSTPAFRRQAAQAIYQGLLSYFRAGSG